MTLARVVALGCVAGVVADAAIGPRLDAPAPPQPGNWTAAPAMGTARQGGAAALLAGGMVLVAGGRFDAGHAQAASSAALFELSGGGSWRQTGEMVSPRFHFGVAGLTDGTALAVGGLDTDYGASLPTAELYRPAKGQWTPAVNMTTARWGCGVAALPDGGVLAVGGVLDPGNGKQTILSSAEMWHPSLEAGSPWKTLAPARVARYFGQAAALQEGGVLLVGGLTNLAAPGTITAAAELYSTVTDSWTVVAAMAIPRHSFGLAALLDGRVIAAGGVTDTGGQQPPAQTAEVYDPSTDAWTAVAPLPDYRYAFALAPLPDGGAIALGGSGWNFTPFLASASRYSSGTAPGAARYRCGDGRCATVRLGEWGLPLAVCQAVCKPALFACVASRCVRSAGGIPAGKCKSVCKPARPGASDD